ATRCRGVAAAPRGRYSAAVSSAVQSRRAGVVGMAIFVGSDALAFAALLFTYVGLRLQAEAWAPAVVPATGVGLGLTALLAGVSASLILARRWNRAGRAGASRGALATALVLAVAFVGAQVWEAAALARAGLRLGDP